MYTVSSVSNTKYNKHVLAELQYHTQILQTCTEKHLHFTLEMCANTKEKFTSWLYSTHKKTDI